MSKSEWSAPNKYGVSVRPVTGMLYLSATVDGRWFLDARWTEQRGAEANLAAAQAAADNAAKALILEAIAVFGPKFNAFAQVARIAAELDDLRAATERDRAAAEQCGNLGLSTHKGGQVRVLDCVIGQVKEIREGT